MFIKHNTTKTILLGPFQDTNGDPQTALSITQAEIQISKAGGSFAQTSQTTAPTHAGDGYYAFTFHANDVNTLGELVISIDKTGSSMVRHQYYVCSANYYDFIHDTDKPRVDVLEVAAAIRDLVVEPEGAHTLGHVLAYALSVLAGRTSSQGLVMNTPDNAAERVSGTVSNGDRSSVTLTPPTYS